MVSVLLTSSLFFSPLVALPIGIFPQSFKAFLNAFLILELFDWTKPLLKTSVVSLQLMPCTEAVEDEKLLLSSWEDYSLKVLFLQLNTESLYPNCQEFVHESMLLEVLTQLLKMCSFCSLFELPHPSCQRVSYNPGLPRPWNLAELILTWDPSPDSWFQCMEDVLLDLDSPDLIRALDEDPH